LPGDQEHISHVKKHLGEQFQMSDLSSLSYFLGIEVLQTLNGYYLSQYKYIQDLVAQSSISDNCMASTRMDIHLQLRPNGGPSL
jgi:hypothetical protein